MKSSAKNMRLTSVDELFSTEESRTDAAREKVVELPLNELHPFKNHPFKVVNDEKMQDTAQSIREHGVLVPAIVRPREEGGYEIVAGHRRHFASQIAGLTTPWPMGMQSETCISIRQMLSYQALHLYKPLRTPSFHSFVC